MGYRERNANKFQASESGKESQVRAALERKADLFIQSRDSVASRRLLRLLAADEAAQKAAQVAERLRQRQLERKAKARRKEVLRWDKNETEQASQERLTRLLSH